MLRKSQQGLSFYTVMLLAPLVGLFVLVVIKLIPVYLEYSTVKSVLNDVVTDRTSSYKTVGEVRTTLSKRLQVNEVKNVEPENVTVERQGPVYSVAVEYEVVTPLFYNIAVLVTFSDTVEVPAI